VVGWLLVSAVDAGPQPGEGGAPGWTNDLAAGEDRRRIMDEKARPCRHAVGDRWQVDETYVKVAGQWRYVYRAVDQFGQVIDVFMSRRRTVGSPVLRAGHRHDQGDPD
jgi:transposase InsO family protein